MPSKIKNDTNKEKKEEVKKEEQPRKSLIEKACTQGEAQNLEKDEILDIIFWFRQVVSIAYGIIAGLSGLTGAPVIVGYVGTMLGSSYYYQNNFLEIDADDFNPNEIMMEGMSNSIGLFLLLWILLFTFISSPSQ